MDSADIRRALDELSDRIRRARQAAGLSLAEFGKRCDLSASAIQKIENRAMTPSVSVVMKIAAGLGVHVGDLIAPPDVVDADLVVQRAGEHTQLQIGETRLQCFRLSSAIVGSKLEAWRIVAAPRSRSLMVRPQRTFEQIVFCERGRIELELDHKTYSLAAGDTLHCLDKSLYSIANPGDEEAAYVIAGEYPHTVPPVAPG
jgi:transcriptional regulator with XRE-family HTH domain